MGTKATFVCLLGLLVGYTILHDENQKGQNSL